MKLSEFTKQLKQSLNLQLKELQEALDNEINKTFNSLEI